MINYEKAHREMVKYLAPFDHRDPMIKLKISHTFEVVRLSKMIAEGIGLDDEQVQLAGIIGLLHDIGRFPQAEQFGDFSDISTVDHAVLGVRILQENDMLRKFVQEDTYDSVILHAVLNHNRFIPDPGPDSLHLLHARLIRDADKVDNFRVKAEDPIEAIAGCTQEELESSDASEEVVREFMSGHQILSASRKTHLDKWISYTAFVFDFNFLPGLVYVRDNDMITASNTRFTPNKPENVQLMKEVTDQANAYVRRRIEELSHS